MKSYDIFIPKDPGGKDNALFVSVNGRHYSVMKGVRVSVPLEVKEVIEASFASDREAELFIRSNIKE